MLSCRTAFISDVHLGARGCQADSLLAFLDQLDCETLYLVGDIVDGWKLKGGWFWPKAHSAVLQALMRRAQAGVKIVYVPGNHDDRLRDVCGLHFAGIEVVPDAIHEARDGRRYLVVHGDAFDGDHDGMVSLVGDLAYRALTRANTGLNRMRERFGLGYWSLSAAVKLRVGTVVRYIDGFERAVARAAAERGVDGVICGHIHHAALRQIAGVTYINDGDWVESCTAAVERHDGRFELVRWPRAAAARKRSATPMRPGFPSPVEAGGALNCASEASQLLSG